MLCAGEPPLAPSSSRYSRCAEKQMTHHRIKMGVYFGVKREKWTRFKMIRNLSDFTRTHPYKLLHQNQPQMPIGWDQKPESNWAQYEKDMRVWRDPPQWSRCHTRRTEVCRMGTASRTKLIGHSSWASSHMKTLKGSGISHYPVIYTSLKK